MLWVTISQKSFHFINVRKLCFEFNIKKSDLNSNLTVVGEGVKRAKMPGLCDFQHFLEYL